MLRQYHSNCVTLIAETFCAVRSSVGQWINELKKTKSHLLFLPVYSPKTNYLKSYVANIRSNYWKK
ncbi:hypothetical protein AM629_08175 [Photorhabdus heterorhabditis]|uniref:Tc1-like transposase DDE domain-containing protein n=1 Tax=Photorhabdus heterorhabditis TaxID=880156 RepID=A0ABR5KD48_9GAMM|nr:hypothetical protein AM629_08175 [Photorhabdus heterorhabditis]